MGDGTAVRCVGCAAQSVEDRALPGVVQPDHHHLVLAAAKDAVVQVREAGAHNHCARHAAGGATRGRGGTTHNGLNPLVS